MKKGLVSIADKIQELSHSMGGVFSYGDLCNIIATLSPLKDIRIINRMIQEGVLFKIKRGFYATKAPDLWVLASRLREGCAVTMDSVLAKNGLVGTLLARSVSAISPGGKKKTVQTPSGIIRYFSINPDLFFGIQKMKNGVQAVDNEKAYLDLLYYYVKGARFVFDPKNEVDLGKLDTKKMKKYLNLYRNKKFVTFVKGLIR